MELHTVGLTENISEEKLAQIIRYSLSIKIVWQSTDAAVTEQLACLTGTHYPIEHHIVYYI
jgi:hypothetical protein